MYHHNFCFTIFIVGKGMEQYHRDYALEDPGSNWLFSEYLEMGKFNIRE